MDKQQIKAEGTLKAVLEQAERVSKEPRTNLNSWGYQYDVNTKLRNQFPKSYFMPDGYDTAIVGVDCITGSIIYDWMHAGYLYVAHAEDIRANLEDRIYGGGRMIHWINELTTEELQGKPRPTIVMQACHLEYWEDRLYHMELKTTDQISKKDSSKGTLIEPPNEFEMECYLRSVGLHHYYNSDFPEEDLPSEMAEEVMQWELFQLAH